MIDGPLSSFGQQTFQSIDTINGGQGTDTLNATLVGTTTSATLSNIEIINFQSAQSEFATGAANNTVNLSGLSTLTNLNLNGSGANSGFVINNIGSVPSVKLQGVGLASALNFDASALAGTNALSLTLEDVNGGTNSTAAGTLTLSRNVSGALETINLVSSGALNNITGLTTSGLGTTTLNVSGNTNITLGTITDSGNALKTINAGTLNGALSVTALSSSTITGGSGNDAITTNGGGQNSVDGGTGADLFIFDAGIARTDSVSGGLGTDALRVGTASVNAGTVYTNIAGIEALQLSSALAGTVTLSNVQAGLQSVTLRDGGAASTGVIVFDGTLTPSAYTVNIGQNGTTAALQSRTTLGGALTVQVAGTGTSDAVTINGNTYQTAALAAQNVFGANAINANGVESLSINVSQSVQGGTAAAVAQTIGAVTFASTGGTRTTLNISGNNATTIGITNAGNIDASGLTTNAGGVASGLTMTAGSTATSIVGSGGADTLLANANAASSIEGGAGNDTITGGNGNDTLRGGEGQDQITVQNATGGVSVEGGAGNDTVIMNGAAVQSTSTVKGGEGIDTLRLTNVAANITANNAASISEFDVLEVQAAGAVGLDMSGFVNNPFTQINAANTAAGVLTLSNLSSTFTTLGLQAGSAGDSVTLTRQVDVTTNALTIRNTDGGDYSGANAITAITAVDEETMTINTTGVNAQGATQNGNVTITTLTGADLTTLNLTGSGNVNLTTIAGAISLATVNASGLSGTFTANAGSSTVGLTLTSGLGATNFTSGAGADSLTGSGVGDTLNGGIGADTINGAGGVDSITAGAGADQVTGGSGIDTFVQGRTDGVASTTTATGAAIAAGTTLTYTNGADVITDFLAGATGDVLALQLAGVPTSLLGTLLNAALANGSTGLLSGTWNASSRTFTVTADGAGPDTMIFQGDGALNITTTTSAVVLQGVDTDNLVAANFGGAAPAVVTAAVAGNVLTFGGSLSTGTLSFNAVTGVITYTGGASGPAAPTGTYTAAAVTSIDLSGIVPVSNANNIVTVSLGTGVQNAALATVIGSTGSDNFVLADTTLLTAAPTTTITGGAGTDTLTITNMQGAAANIAAAQLVAIENVSLTNGTLDTGAAERVLTLNNPALAVTNASANANASVTFAAGTTGSSFTTASTGAQTIVINDTSTSVTTGAGTDAIRVNNAGTTFATTSVVGGGGVDTLNIFTGAAAATTYAINGTRISGIETVNFDVSNATAIQTLTITDAGVATLAVTDAAAATAFATNATVSSAGGFTYSNTDATVGSLLFSSAYNGLFTIAAAGLGAAHTITFSANADTVSMTAANLETARAATAPISGGAGTDTLTITTALDANDLDTVVLFETINVNSNAAVNALTTANGLVAAGQTVTINNTVSTGANSFTFNGSAEADGSFIINLGAANTNTVTTGQLADTVIGGAGADTINVANNAANGNDVWTGNGGADVFVLTRAQNTVDTGTVRITDYKANGADLIQLDLTAAGVISNRATIGTIVTADNFVIMTAALSTAEITTGVAAAAAANNAIIVFNSSTSRAEIWFDADWQTTAGRTQIATVDNITTLVGVTGLSGVNGVDFNIA